MSMQQQHQPTEQELDAIYKYLSIAYESMSNEEQKMWTAILMQNDPEFDDVAQDDEE